MLQMAHISSPPPYPADVEKDANDAAARLYNFFFQIGIDRLVNCPYDQRSFEKE